MLILSRKKLALGNATLLSCLIAPPGEKKPWHLSTRLCWWWRKSRMFSLNQCSDVMMKTFSLPEIREV